MHPVLFAIPLPRWNVPLGPAMLVAAALSLVVAAVGRRARATDLVVTGLTGAALTSVLAVRLWGTSSQLEPMPIYAFGACFSVAVAVGLAVISRVAARDGLPHDVVLGACLATAVAGLLGARLLYVLTNLGDFHSVVDMLAFRSGGLVFYGAVVGGVLGAHGFLRSRRQGSAVTFASFADAAAPGVCVAAVVGRVGCYLAGCDYGVPLPLTAPRWLARLGTFPRWPDDVAGPAAGAPAWLDHVLYRGLPLDSKASLPVHPTQLYEALALLGLALTLRAARRHRRFPGQVFGAFVLGYGALRFLLETLRDDPERRLLGPAGAPPLVWAVGALLLAVCFALGPARSIRSTTVRTASTIAALLVPALVAVLAGSRGGTIALSTSQWIAVACFVVAVPLWGRLEGRSARAAGSSAT